MVDPRKVVLRNSWREAEVQRPLDDAPCLISKGLCPGLNDIIQGVTNCLWRDYGVRHIVGVTAGYNGLSDPESHPSVPLNPTYVETVHLQGGSVLKAGRGGFDAAKICTTLEQGGYTHLFVIGGDGTQYAGHLLYEECRKRKLYARNG